MAKVLPKPKKVISISLFGAVLSTAPCALAEQPFAWREAMFIEAVPIARAILERVPLDQLDLNVGLERGLSADQVETARGFFKINPDTFYNAIEKNDRPKDFEKLSHLEKLQALLIQDFSNTKLVFIHSATPEKGSCAKTTDTERPSSITFYLKNCDREVESLFNAASFLVGETFHHFNFPDATMDAFRHAYEKACLELEPERAKELSVVRLERPKDYKKIMEVDYFDRLNVIERFSDESQNRLFFIGFSNRPRLGPGRRVQRDEKGEVITMNVFFFSASKLSGYREDTTGNPGTGGMFTLAPDNSNVLGASQLRPVNMKFDAGDAANFNCHNEALPVVMGQGEARYEDWTHFQSECFAPFPPGNLYRPGRGDPESRVIKRYQSCVQKFPVSLKYVFDKNDKLFGINVKIQKPTYIRADVWVNGSPPCGNHGPDGRPGDWVTESNFFVL
jgi:hypothetical protein